VRAVTDALVTALAAERDLLHGRRHLRVAIRELVEHYHLEGNHQGVDTDCSPRSRRRRMRTSIPLHRSRGGNASAASLRRLRADVQNMRGPGGRAA
jgi:hypothetical protein